MLPKDNESIPVPAWTTESPVPELELQPFAPAQMVPCEHCLRTNPPTRVNCLYCGAVLPINESTLELQKPTLRRLERWELGYNNILLPTSANAPDELQADVGEAADILKLAAADLMRILSSEMALPVARAATADEAMLVQRRLRACGIETSVVSDEELGAGEAGPFRVRLMDITVDELIVFQNPESLPIKITWADLLLLVTGRLISTRVELKEEKAARAENRILDASQFFTDEVVFECYAVNQAVPFRVAANSFDFSCLEGRKGLVSGENMTTLVEILRERAPHVEVDNTYDSLRKVLEPVWPMEQQNESTGWRRERPGKYSIGSVTQKSNETQFMRYSLLRRYLHSRSRTRVE